VKTGTFALSTSKRKHTHTRTCI